MPKGLYTIPANLMVEGIREARIDAISVAGELELPPEFNTKTQSAKWCIEGPSVDAAKRPEVMVGAQHYQIDGWNIWKDPKGQICRRVLGSGKALILMHRPLVLQRAVNAISGNMSKLRLQAEHTGKTVAGGQRETGMLVQQELSPFDPANNADYNTPLPISFNAIPAATQLNETARARSVKKKAA